MQLYTWGEQIKINGEMHAKIELGNFSSFYSCKEIHSAHIVANTAYVCEHVRGREKNKSHPARFCPLEFK